MLAEDIPTSMVLLTADLKIIDANEEFLREVGRDLDDLVGHHLFEEFPKMPERPSGHQPWTAVEAAMTSGKREHNVLFREDVEDPDSRASSLSTTGRPSHSPSGTVTATSTLSSSACGMSRP